MPTRRRTRAAYSALGLLGVSLGLGTAATCSAQSAQGSAASAARPSLGEALKITAETGKPTIVVVTSKTNPASQKLWRALQESAQVKELEKSAQFVEMPSETHAGQIRKIGVTIFPTVIAYGKGANGLQLLGSQGSARDAQNVVGWLRGIGVGSGSAGEPISDTSLRHAAFVQDGSPQSTPQGPPPQQPAPPAVQQPQPQPPPQYVPVMQAQPMVSVPQPTVVPQPGASLFIQPQQSSIIMGSAPPPAIYHVQQAPSLGAPNLMLPAQPTQPMMMAAHAPTVAAAPPAAQPTFLMAAQPAQPTLAAAGPAPSISAIVLTRPGPINRGLAAFGRVLVERGNPRVSMNAQTSIMQMTVPTTTLQQPTQQVQYVQPQPQHVVETVPETTYASPQSTPHKHFLGHHHCKLCGK